MITSGTDAFSTLAEFKVIVPVFAMITPPLAANGDTHSTPALRGVAVLYCKDAEAPYVGAAEAVAVPSMERTPFTVTPEMVLSPLPDKVRLLYVSPATVCAPFALYSTVPVLDVKVPPVPLTVPLIFKVLEPPFKVPLVRVQLVKVCVNPVPRLSVPPAPLIVRPLPPTLPVNVAVPPVLVIVTVPVVVNLPMFWSAVPLIVMFEALAANVPLLVKSPPKVRS